MSPPPVSAADRLADLLVRARREGRRVSLAEAGAEIESADDAYAVQRTVGERAGLFSGRPTAWKVGASAPGATPTAAALPPAGVVRSPATFAAGRFHSIHVEAEIAFRLAKDLPPGGDAAAAVGEICVTIEVVDSRLTEALDAPPFAKLADAGVHGALVVGSGIPFRPPVDWTSLRTVVRRNGAVAVDVRGGHALPDPVVLLPWLAQHAVEQGGGLRAGDVITAGTWVGVVPAARGDAIEVAFDGVGEASVRFE